MDPIEVVTLEDGGQRAEDVAARLVAWLEAARESLDLALYDVRLPGPVGDDVAGAIRGARDRGVRIRIMFNQDEREEEPRPFEPPPPRTEPDLLEQLGVPLKPIPGWRDLMHHKYAVRDGAAVWTGSCNWTLDNWTRAENVLATVASPELAAGYTRDFEQMWARGKVDERDGFDAAVSAVGDATVRPWFCPGRGPELSQRIAERIGTARRRVRIASPVLTAGPILGTLNEVLAEGRLDVAGVCDATQIAQVFDQWAHNPRSQWKAPAAAPRARGLPRQALDPVHARVGPQLHAREGHRRRRHDLPRLLQPLALGRDERRERARDRRRGAGRPHGGLDRRAAVALPTHLGWAAWTSIAHLAGAYERAAPEYERTGVANHAPFSEHLAQSVLLGPGGRVLDVGCGAGGALLPAAHRVGPTGEAVGIDIAPGMVERTRAAAEEAGLEQVRAEVMDGAALDVRGRAFRRGAGGFTLALIPDADGALAEWRRVLRPTGTVGVAVWTDLGDDAWAWEGELNHRFARRYLRSCSRRPDACSGASPRRRTCARHSKEPASAT